MNTQQAEALTRATTGNSFSNYNAILEGFAGKGLREDEIKPRENIFTYAAWRALGRQVRKGEHGIKIETWIPCKSKELDKKGNPKIYKRRKITTVFHESQTDQAHA